MLIITIYFFLFGLIIGSFLNVAVLRYNTGKSLSGRSGCFSCGHGLSWLELIPVFSFLAQKGRCKYCGSKISRQYPLVELLTAGLFALTAWKFYPDFFAIGFYLLILSLLIVIITYDFKHKIIPDEPAYLIILLAVLSPVILNFNLGAAEIGWMILSNLVGGFTIFALFFCLWYFSGGRWMGFGDAKLAFGLGALLGLRGAANAVILAFWIGAIIGLCLVALSKLNNIKSLKRRFSIKSELPFAPFLALGMVLYLFFDLVIFAF